jgi:hypothetical protein
MAPARSASSIAQVIIVLGITATLSTFTLGAARALETGSKRAKTSTILATLSKGMSLTVASRGALLSPSEHGLAGSRPGRAEFLGLRGRTSAPTGSWPAARCASWIAIAKPSPASRSGTSPTTRTGC